MPANRRGLYLFIAGFSETGSHYVALACLKSPSFSFHSTGLEVLATMPNDSTLLLFNEKQGGGRGRQIAVGLRPLMNTEYDPVSRNKREHEKLPVYPTTLKSDHIYPSPLKC